MSSGLGCKSAECPVDQAVTTYFNYATPKYGLMAGYVPFQAYICIIDNKFVGQGCPGTANYPSYDLWQMLGIESGSCGMMCQDPPGAIK